MGVRRLFPCAFALALAACGGGGGGGGGESSTADGSGNGLTSIRSECRASGNTLNCEHTLNPAPGGTPAPGNTADIPADTPAANPAGENPGEVASEQPSPPSTAPDPQAPAEQSQTPPPATESPLPPVAENPPPESAPPAADDPPESDPPPVDEPPSFTATLQSAPADGALLTGPVRLEVRGTGLRNVELLPPDGYLPRLGVFNITDDGTLAWLDFDAADLPNGRLRTRIVAFAAPAGQAGEQVEVMSARTWSISRNPVPMFRGSAIPPASYMPEVHLLYRNWPYVDPAPLDELIRLSDEELALRLQQDGPAIRQLLYRYLPPHVLWMPPFPRSEFGEWQACADDLNPLTCPFAIRRMADYMHSITP